jgi:hypothetical protein
MAGRSLVNIKSLGLIRTILRILLTDELRLKIACHTFAQGWVSFYDDWEMKKRKPSFYYPNK